MKNAKGLTWLEAIAVVAMLLLLVALLLPAAGRARFRSGPVCGGNLAGIGKALTVYAGEYDGRLPVFSDAEKCQWLSDESPQILSVVVGSAASSDATKIFYCPQDTHQDPNQLSNWNGIIVTGYVFLNDRGPDAKNMPQNFPPQIPPVNYISTLNLGAGPADQILGVDWIVSNSRVPAKVNSSSIRRPGSPITTYSTSHVTGDSPSGANVLSVDGSVQWRKFNPAKAGAIKQPGSASAYFWIPSE